MSQNHINKSELARIVGTSAAYITKLEKKGLFDHCTDGKELLRFEAIETYLESSDFTRDSQREANAKNKDLSKIYITKKDLAAAFGLKSATEITRLDKQNIFDDCYDAKKLRRIDALRAYVDYVLKKESPIKNDIPTSTGENTDEEFKPKTVKDIRDFYETLITTAKTASQKANISKEEDIKIEKFLKNQELEKKLVDTSVVEAEAFEMARKVRDSFLSLPDRLSSELVGKDKREIHQVLSKEINYVLEVLSNEK